MRAPPSLNVTSDKAPPEARSAPGNGLGAHFETDSLDCFNEDLTWILERLVERAGGSFGIFSRHIKGESATILARTTEGPIFAGDFWDALANFVAPVVETERRSRGEMPAHVRQSCWSSDLHGEVPSDYRVLQFEFAPTQNVNLVASVVRPGGSTLFTAFEELTAAKLYPVLARYIRLWWLHRMERRRANSFSAALDLSDVGVIMLDRRFSLTFANSRANALLASQDGLQHNARFITASRPDDDVRLQAALQHALQRNLAQSAHDPDRQQAPILTLQRKHRRRALIATIVSVQDCAIDPRDPAIIIYVFDPEQNIEQALAPVCRMYKLTAGEMRLVHQLVSGMRIVEAAQHMQIRPDTARAYLKQVFIKTATNRQVDLVRLMYTSMSRTNAKMNLTIVRSS